VVDVGALRRKGETRHHIDAELTQEQLRAALADTDAEIDQPARIRLDLLLQADGSIVVTGDMKLAFTVPCARCLDPARVDGDTTITALVVRDGAAKAKIPGNVDVLDEDLDDEDDLGADVWTYDGSTLELLPMLGEIVKLAYPMRQLCARGADCRGLCSRCGAPLNEQPPGVPCQACGMVDPRVPEVDEIPAPTPAENPLQAALRKLQTPE